MISDINYAVAFWTSRIGARGGGADNANGHHAQRRPSGTPVCLLRLGIQTTSAIAYLLGHGGWSSFLDENQWV